MPQLWCSAALLFSAAFSQMIDVCGYSVSIGPSIVQVALAQTHAPLTMLRHWPSPCSRPRLASLLRWRRRSPGSAPRRCIWRGRAQMQTWDCIVQRSNLGRLANLGTRPGQQSCPALSSTLYPRVRSFPLVRALRPAGQCAGAVKAVHTEHEAGVSITLAGGRPTEEEESDIHATSELWLFSSTLGPDMRAATRTHLSHPSSSSMQSDGGISPAAECLLARIHLVAVHLVRSPSTGQPA